MSRHHPLLSILLALALLTACATPGRVRLGQRPSGGEWLTITLQANPEIYPHHFGLRYPQFAIWVQAEGESRAQTLFVTRKTARQAWIGAKRRPESLPIWEGLRDAESSARIAAVSGATPVAREIVLDLPLPPQWQGKALKVFLEANVSFDFNAAYPQPSQGDPAPRSSPVNGQPALLYRAFLPADARPEAVLMAPQGVGDALGRDHALRPDLSRLDTAKRLFLRPAVRRLTHPAE